MPAWKLVYRIFRRIVLTGVLLSGLHVMSGCSDPAQSAMEMGALAQSQLDSGQLAAARKTIGEAIAERDDIAELHLLRGRIELAANSPETAYGAFAAALSLDSANMEALIGVAQLGLQSGHVAESEDATNRVLAFDPKQPNALLLRGLHDIIKRRYDDAISRSDQILEIMPNDENAAILKARALALTDRSDEAFATVERARKASGNTLSVALTLIELHRVKNDGAAMVPLLERVRKLSPADSRYDIDEADTLYKLGSAPRARAILRRRLLDGRLDEKSATAITRLWKEYDPEPLDAAALAEFAKSAGKPARKAVARLYLDRNDPGRARAALAGATSSDDIAALRARAGALEGRLDESLAQAEAIVAKDRTHCDALIAKAQALLAKRRADDAIAASTLASTTCPQMPVAFLTLARAQEADGNKAGAMVALRDAFDRNDQDSALVRTYTGWLEREGQSTRAVSIARRLTRNAPSLLSGWRLYAELCSRNPDADCGKEAQAGLTRAEQRFGVDPRSDEPLSTGLFGRLERE